MLELIMMLDLPTLGIIQSQLWKFFKPQNCAEVIGRSVWIVLKLVDEINNGATIKAHRKDGTVVDMIIE